MAPDHGGDSTADRTSPPFEEFYAQRWSSTVRLASSLTQDPAVGEEIAQDVLAAMWQRWGVAERPEAYLRTAVVNACNTRHRRLQVNRIHQPLIAVPDRVDFVADELADVIDGLPYRQRAVVILRYRFDLSEREIATVLECRPGTVKSLASRALKRLGHQLR